MLSSRMRTVRNSSRLLPSGADPPREPTPPGSRPPRADPPCCKACWDATCNACWDTTPFVDRMTDTCKNITFATSLRTVKTHIIVGGLNVTGNGRVMIPIINCGLLSPPPVFANFFTNFLKSDNFTYCCQGCFV